MFKKCNIVNGMRRMKYYDIRKGEEDEEQTLRNKASEEGEVNSHF